MTTAIKNYLSKTDRPALSGAPDRPSNALKTTVHSHGLRAPVPTVSINATPRPTNHVPRGTSPAMRARPDAAPANGLDAAMNRLANRTKKGRSRSR